MAVHERLSLRSAYLYLVCLIMLVLAIFAGVNLVRDAVQLVYPAQDYYVEMPAQRDGGTAYDVDRQREVAAQAQRRRAVQGMVGSGAMLLISVPVYGYHWRQVQRETPTAVAVTTGGA